ncbi:CaiB/BaiF CoA transferase family protein [Streptomyces hyderabadensis]|uniref:CoA transferase n=1 Tax=Streptomyces hyderabadensis TaxID=598549 RepID=A0ABP9IPH5_9ACTN|nr:CoA transferase [Streptomyces hyderabadensis]
MSDNATSRPGPLQGVRVIDFGWVLAGPYATMLLSYLGAEVIKVESRRRVDEQRIAHRAGLSEEVEASSNFLEVNLGKGSVSLNIATPEGAELARRLVATADVAIENMRPGVMDRLGLGYDALSEVKPDLIMVSISGWGATGPLRDYTAYAPCFSSYSGLAHLTGYADGEPGTGTSSNDARAGTAAAFAILMALNIRERTGEGQYIDLAASLALNALVGDSVLEYAMTGESPARDGNRDRLMAPHNVYRCKGEDRWISIAVGDDTEWAKLRETMGDPPWAADETFATAAGRRAEEDRLDALLEEWTLQYEPMELTELLQSRGVAAMPSFSAEELFNSPHLVERGAVTEVAHPVLGRRQAVSPPWKLSETPASIRSTAPLLGQSNDEVFGRLLGLPAEEIERLKKAKVIY